MGLYMKWNRRIGSLRLIRLATSSGIFHPLQVLKSLSFYADTGIGGLNQCTFS